MDPAGAGSGERSGEPELIVAPDSETAAAEAAARIAAALTASVAARGVAHWVTTGGSTPAGIYRRLADPSVREAVPWARVHLWWGDDRWVPDTDILSNAVACWDLLLSSVPVPVEQVHAMPIGRAMAEGRSVGWTAQAYEDELRAAHLPANGTGLPIFDVILVGIGSDGHVLSVFPGSATWDDSAWVQSVPAPTHIAPHVDRVTLHPRVLDAGRLLLVVTHGASKAAIVGRVFGPREDERALPALLVRRREAVWILDEAAAAAIPPNLRQPSGGVRRD